MPIIPSTRLEFALIERHTRHESTIERLTTRRDELTQQLAARVQGTQHIHRVLAFAKSLGPNVDKATKDFAVCRGLREDLQVTAR
jgi:hypothetical protein